MDLSQHGWYYALPSVVLRDEVPTRSPLDEMDCLHRMVRELLAVLEPSILSLLFPVS